eukprot:scaffold261870_cov17-Tisochrysis_lutea.AAC.1
MRGGRALSVYVISFLILTFFHPLTLASRTAPCATPWTSVFDYTKLKVSPKEISTISYTVCTLQQGAPACSLPVRQLGEKQWPLSAAAFGSGEPPNVEHRRSSACICHSLKLRPLPVARSLWLKRTSSSCS